MPITEEEWFVWKYPVGKFSFPDQVSLADRQAWLNVLEAFPGQLEATVAGWKEEKWDTPYRPEGWTARQLIHHIADSHVQALGRVRLALTESEPVIKPYHQDGWAKLKDSLEAPALWSLDMLRGVHARWHFLLANLEPGGWERAFYHPETKVRFTLERATALYAWHSRHHLAHLARMNGK